MFLGDIINIVCVDYDEDTIAVLEDGPYWRCQTCQNLCRTSSDHYMPSTCESPEVVISC